MTVVFQGELTDVRSASIVSGKEKHILDAENEISLPEHFFHQPFQVVLDLSDGRRMEFNRSPLNDSQIRLANLQRVEVTFSMQDVKIRYEFNAEFSIPVEDLGWKGWLLGR
ncbi:hypothetical protein AB1L42_23610 [Thalassoglobus sp. JC818]|uniref:hypothetical protein n=1 Tax=Thalassoglobus sp. JC818 TaxID=3232136 RepID=UPI0034597195